MAPKQTDPQFKLRMTPEIKAAIEKAAVVNNRSMNAEILARLQTTIEMDAYEPGDNAHPVETAEIEARLSGMLDTLKHEIDEIRKSTEQMKHVFVGIPIDSRKK